MTQAFQPRAGAPRAGTALGTPSAQRADPRRDRPAGPVVAARAGTRVTRHPAGTPPPRVTAGRPAFPDPGPVLLLKFIPQPVEQHQQLTAHRPVRRRPGWLACGAAGRIRLARTGLCAQQAGQLVLDELGPAQARTTA